MFGIKKLRGDVENLYTLFSGLTGRLESAISNMGGLKVHVSEVNRLRIAASTRQNELAQRVTKLEDSVTLVAEHIQAIAGCGVSVAKRVAALENVRRPVDENIKVLAICGIALERCLDEAKEASAAAVERLNTYGDTLNGRIQVVTDRLKEQTELNNTLLDRLAALEATTKAFVGTTDVHGKPLTRPFRPATVIDEINFRASARKASPKPKR